MKKVLKHTARVSLYVFALIGFILTFGFFAIKFGFTNTKGIVDEQRSYFLNNHTPAWTKTEEWQTIKDAILKDRVDIKKASALSGTSERLIVTQLIVEQMRLFYSEREIFKAVFSPLKILGNQTQFSWGVTGIKEETARAIEDNLKNSSSTFYLGKDFETILDFKKDDINKERFQRLTDEKSRYYSYLYTGLYLRQIKEQWAKEGFDLSKRPEIFTTLFNIGFKKSVPKSNPKPGGASIEIEDVSYSFGTFGAEFYYSDELLEEFPRE